MCTKYASSIQLYLTLVPCAHVLITFLQITISLITNTGLLVIQYAIIKSLILYQAVHFHMIYMHTFLTMTIGIKIKADKQNLLQSRRTTSLLDVSLISNAQLHYSCLKITQLPNTTECGLTKSSPHSETVDFHLLFSKDAYCVYCLNTQKVQQRE